MEPADGIGGNELNPELLAGRRLAGRDEGAAERAGAGEGAGKETAGR